MPDLYGAHKAIPSASDSRTGAAASADLILSHASRARWMGEWTYGVNTANTPPCAFIPAHSTAPGHDHSGGVMGTPIVRPLWECAFGMPDAALTTGNINNGRALGATITTSAVSGEKAFVYGSGVLGSVWIPGCPKDSIAHRRGKMVLSLYADHAITVYVQCQDADVFSKSLTAAAFTEFELDQEVLLVPGEYNDIPFSAWVQGTPANNTIVTLVHLSINQTRTVP